MSTSARILSDAREIRHIRPIIITTPNQDIDEPKWDRQMRAIKQVIGPKEVFSAISAILSLIAISLTIILSVGSPVARQVGINEASAASLDNLKAAVKENKEEQNKAISETAARLETGMAKLLDEAKQNREDMRAMSTRFESQFTEQRQKTDALWQWNGLLEGKLKAIETELKTKKETK